MTADPKPAMPQDDPAWQPPPEMADELTLHPDAREQYRLAERALMLEQGGPQAGRPHSQWVLLRMWTEGVNAQDQGATA